MCTVTLLEIRIPTAWEKPDTIIAAEWDKGMGYRVRTLSGDVQLSLRSGYADEHAATRAAMRAATRQYRKLHWAEDC